MMKKVMLSIILTVFVLTGAGCSKSDHSDLLIEPQYELAEFRSEIGNLFYETDEKIGITTSFGFFIYSLNEDKLLSAFNIDHVKAFGEDFLAEARLSKDEKSIYLSGYSHDKTIDDYYFRYNLETGTLHKVEQAVTISDFYPLPDQNRNAFETTNWKAEDLTYYPPEADTPLYPFKNIN